MHEIKELKERLCRELEEYARKDMSTGTLEVVDRLANTVKNLGKIIMMYEDENGEGEYSYYDGEGNMSYDGNYDGRNSYEGGMSNARGRRGNVRRDRYGRYSNEGGYSRNEEVVAKLNEIMRDAPDDRTRQEVKRLIDKMRNM